MARETSPLTHDRIHKLSTLRQDTGRRSTAIPRHPVAIPRLRSVLPVALRFRSGRGRLLTLGPTRGDILTTFLRHAISSARFLLKCEGVRAGENEALINGLSHEVALAYAGARFSGASMISLSFVLRSASAKGFCRNASPCPRILI